jgi:hypothetical protein
MKMLTKAVVFIVRIAFTVICFVAGCFFPAKQRDFTIVQQDETVRTREDSLLFSNKELFCGEHI